MSKSDVPNGTVAVCGSARLSDMIGLLLTLVVVGVILWLIETQIPISQPIKVVIRVVVVLILVLWLLQVFGISDLAIPRIR